jgi:hypothetical protein
VKRAGGRGRVAWGAGLVCLAALAMAFAAPGRAFADDDAPELVKMRFFERGPQLLVTTSLTKLFDSGTYAELESGISALLLIRFWVYPKGSTDAVSFLVIQRRVLYNMWDEVYEVELDEPGGRRVVKVKYKAEALKLLTSIDSLPVARLDRIPYEKHHMLAMVVELNPVSQETLAEVRRWLSEGSGGGLERGGSFFGSFVSVFVNLKVPDADRVLRIQSQPFFRPRPETPVPASTAYPPGPPPRPAGPPPPGPSPSPPPRRPPPSAPARR